MVDLLKHVGRTISTRRLLRAGESVVVAVSGGADSMVLLHILHRLAQQNFWKLTVAHLNHRLRGRSSDADERLVVRTCRKLKLKVITARADVKRLAAKRKLSIEMAARQARHEFLARTAKKLNVSTIALAHHGDDQLELFFLRLLRGSGSDGLAGMKWKNASPADPGIQLIRPFLDLPKGELLDHATENRVFFREDASNASADFQRNRIRHELLPLLRKHYQPALDRVIGRVIEIADGESACLDQAAREWLEGQREPLFSELHVAIQRRCIQLQLRKLQVATDFDLVEWLRTRPEQTVSAGSNVRLVADERGAVRIERDVTTFFSMEQGRVEVDLKEKQSIPFAQRRIEWHISKSRSQTFPTKALPGREVFDADKVGGKIVLRHWQSGDRFQPLGMAKPVKLQDLFTNQKIPRAQRHALIVA
ncbi:MAG TPA: tRNA lysidine(34) synthetase TilS, partial [Candidatus Paceibacterota bacterium]|nr:tRNA lysidine(34) synthetase TilS [Candidatus Paceibacterota bacterium]